MVDNNFGESKDDFKLKDLRKLKKDLLIHLIVSGTKDIIDLKRNLGAQKEMKTRCFDCEAIARQMNIQI